MTQRTTQECFGCGDSFITYKNYDYCANCAINNNRYISHSNCSECDGSGWIKFKNRTPRPCKLCALTKPNMNQKPTKLTSEEKYWNQVDQLAQAKIYQVLTHNIPFQNIPLITEPYRFEEAQPKKVGLFLRRDVDYRTLLVDLENEWYERVYEHEEKLPEPESLAEEITLWYCRMVLKSLISDCREYASYDPSYFENLTTNEY